MDRQTLPVASDTVAFMLSKKLSVDDTVLRTLLHKLGKQNLWLRAREVFRGECRWAMGLSKLITVSDVNKIK